MPKRLHLEEHLSSKELELRYRKAKDPVLRTHLLIVWQLSLGKLTREVGEATGYSPEWIREISRRYNEGGGSRASATADTKTLAPKTGRCSLWSTSKSSKKR